jgi:hypothetical protein
MLTNYSLVRGDTFVRSLYFTDQSDNVIDITGWKIFLTLKKNWQMPDSEASLQKIITSHTDPTNGKSVLEILPADTVNLDPYDYDYDIQVLTNAGAVYTILRGKFKLSYDVTKGTSGI